jgi:hypothetical protein
VAEQEPEKNFGYLDTDEVLDKPVRRQYSMDRAVGSGCFAFTAASIAYFACVAIPFTAAGRVETFDQLYRVAALGAILALAAGLLATHFARLAGLLGSIAGLLPGGVFVYLYLWHEITQAPAIEGYQPPEFSADYSWKVPLVMSGLSALVWLGYYWLLSRGNQEQVDKRSK